MKRSWLGLASTGRPLGRAGLVCLVLAMSLVGTGASRAFFVLVLDETAETWPQGAVPTTLEVPALTHFAISTTPLFVRQALKEHDLEQLRVNQVALVMVAPAEHPSFSFLHALHVVASADGLPDLTVASGTNLPDQTNFAGLDVVDVDLAAYAKSGQMTLRAVVDSADAPPADVVLRLVVNLESYIAQPGAACAR